MGTLPLMLISNLVFNFITVSLLLVGGRLLQEKYGMKRASGSYDMITPVDKAEYLDDEESAMSHLDESAEADLDGQ